MSYTDTLCILSYSRQFVRVFKDTELIKLIISRGLTWNLKSEKKFLIRIFHNDKISVGALDRTISDETKAIIHYNHIDNCQISMTWRKDAMSYVTSRRLCDVDMGPALSICTDYSCSLHLTFKCVVLVNDYTNQALIEINRQNGSFISWIIIMPFFTLASDKLRK